MLLSITTVSTIINVDTSYTFAVNRQVKSNAFDFNSNPLSSIPAGSLLRITFPAQYNHLTAGAFTCTSSNAVTCSLTGSEMTVTGMFPSASTPTSYSVTIQGIRNPSPALTTDSFTMQVRDGSTVVDFSQPSQRLVLSPGAFQSCSATFNPSTVSTRGSLVLALDPTNEIPTSGYIQVTFSSGSWANDPGSNSILLSSQSCTAISNVNSNLACTNPSSTSIRATSLLQTATSGSFSFSADSVLSPPTASSSYTFTVTSFQSTTTNNRIDTCSVTVGGLTPLPITILSSDTNGALVSQQTALRMRFNFGTNNVEVGDVMTFAFPTILQSSVSLISTADFSLSQNPNSAVLTCTTKVDSTNYQIALSAITMPPSVLPSPSITVTVARAGSQFLSGTFTVTAGIRTLSFTVGSTVTEIGKPGVMSFAITTLTAFSSTGVVTISLPSALTASAIPTCAGSGGSVSSSPTCTLSGRTVTISSLATSTQAAGTYTFSITSVTNPDTTLPVTGFNVSVLYDSQAGAFMANLVGGTYTPTPAQLDNSLISVTPSSLVVNNPNTNYLVRFTTRNTLATGSSITLTVPSCVVVNTNVVANNCAVALGAAALTSTSCSPAATANSDGSRTITFPNIFTSSGAAAGTVIQLQVSQSFKNPSSTERCSSFAIRTFSNSYPVDYLDFGISVQMTTPAAFQQAQVAASTLVNSGTTVLTFTLWQESAFQAHSVLRVTLPPELGIATLACADGNSNTLTCSASGQVVTVTLAAATTPASFTVVLSGIKNAISLKTTSTFTVDSGFQIYKYSEQSIAGITNQVAATFKTIGMTFNPGTLGEANTYTLNFQTTGTIPSGGYLLITPPTGMTVGTYSCTYTGFTPTCANDGTNAQILRVTAGSFPTSALTLTVTGLSTGNSAPTTAFTVGSFTADNFKIDENNALNFALACTLPCKSCNSATPTVCTACYSSTSITTRVFLADNNCFEACPNTTIAAGNACTACTSPCATCTGSLTNCTSCPAGQFLNLVTNPNAGTCGTTCPSGSWPNAALDPDRCVACSAPCSTCSSATACLSCATGFLLGTTCVTACPTTGLYIQDSVNMVCTPCSTTCKKCTNTVTECTECNSPKLLQASTCVDACTAPLISNSSHCVSCTAPCATCTGTVTTCVTCITNNFLSGTTCVPTCPTGTFANSATSSCSACSVMTNCLECESAVKCTRCSLPSALYQDQCITTAPTGKVIINGVVESCSTTADCATCVNTVTNCTSCTSRFLSGNTCVGTCPATTFGASNTCSACASPCANCDSQATNCTSCRDNLNPVRYLSGNSCITDCGAGRFGDTSTVVCVACSNNCATCTSSTICTSCAGIYFLQGTQCLTACLPGSVGLNNLCSPCTTGCATCSTSTTNCQTCSNGYFLNGNGCFTTCPAGLYGRKSDNTCAACDAGCVTCENSPTACTACPTPLFLYGVSCISSCPSGSYLSGTTCLGCPVSCATCSNA